MKKTLVSLVFIACLLFNTVFVIYYIRDISKTIDLENIINLFSRSDYALLTFKEPINSYYKMLDYLNSNFFANNKILVARVNEFEYLKRPDIKYIRDIDPKLIKLYQTQNVEQAMDILKNNNVLYLLYPGYETPTFYHSVINKIITDRKHSRLIKAFDNVFLYELKYSNQKDELDTISRKIDFQTETLPDNSLLLSIKDTDISQCYDQQCYLNLELRFFSNISVSLVDINGEYFLKNLFYNEYNSQEYGSRSIVIPVNLDNIDTLNLSLFILIKKTLESQVAVDNVELLKYDVKSNLKETGLHYSPGEQNNTLLLSEQLFKNSNSNKYKHILTFDENKKYMPAYFADGACIKLTRMTDHRNFLQLELFKGQVPSGLLCIRNYFGNKVRYSLEVSQDNCFDGNVEKIYTAKDYILSKVLNSNTYHLKKHIKEDHSAIEIIPQMFLCSEQEYNQSINKFEKYKKQYQLSDADNYIWDNNSATD